MRVGLFLRCVDCKMQNYITKKNKKLHPEKINIKKYCAKCNLHTMHQEKNKK